VTSDEEEQAMLLILTLETHTDTVLGASRLQLPQRQQQMSTIHISSIAWWWPGRKEDTGGEIGHDDFSFMVHLQIQKILGGKAGPKESRAYSHYDNDRI